MMRPTDSPLSLWELVARRELDDEDAGRACLAAVEEGGSSRPLEGAWWIEGTDHLGRIVYGWGAVPSDGESRKTVALAAWNALCLRCPYPCMSVLQRRSSDGGDARRDERLEEAWALAKEAVFRGPVPAAIARFDGAAPRIYLFHDRSVDVRFGGEGEGAL